MYYTEIKHSSHLRTLEKCRKHSPTARAFDISLVFSNACRVLSQCNTRLRLLYLLNHRCLCCIFNQREKAWERGRERANLVPKVSLFGIEMDRKRGGPFRLEFRLRQPKEATNALVCSQMCWVVMFVFERNENNGLLGLITY